MNMNIIECEESRYCVKSEENRRNFTNQFDSIVEQASLGNIREFRGSDQVNKFVGRVSCF